MTDDVTLTTQHIDARGGVIAAESWDAGVLAMRDAVTEELERIIRLSCETHADEDGSAAVLRLHLREVVSRLRALPFAAPRSAADQGKENDH